MLIFDMKIVSEINVISFKIKATHLLIPRDKKKSL